MTVPTITVNSFTVTVDGRSVDIWRRNGRDGNPYWSFDVHFSTYSPTLYPLEGGHAFDTPDEAETAAVAYLTVLNTHIARVQELERNLADDLEQTLADNTQD